MLSDNLVNKTSFATCSKCELKCERSVIYYVGQPPELELLPCSCGGIFEFKFTEESVEKPLFWSV